MKRKKTASPEPPRNTGRDVPVKRPPTTLWRRLKLIGIDPADYHGS